LLLINFRQLIAKSVCSVRFINNAVDNYLVKEQVQKMTLNIAEYKRSWILSTEHERKTCGYSTDVES